MALPDEPRAAPDHRSQPRSSTAYEQLLSDAVTALTAAARLTGTGHREDSTASTRPCDWAEFVSLALAGAAANIGSIESVLAGRPGSWEADAVRTLLTATVGHDEQQLLRHRTDPVVVSINVDDIMVDLAWTGLTDGSPLILAVGHDSGQQTAANAVAQTVRGFNILNLRTRRGRLKLLEGLYEIANNYLL